MKKTLVSLLLCLALCTGCFLPASGAASDEPDALIRGILHCLYQQGNADHAQQYLDDYLPSAAGIGAEWQVVALCQTGGYDFSAYRDALNAYLATHQVASASTRLKFALALLATGDRENPYIASTMADAPGKQGIMSIVYALHMMNNHCPSPIMTKEDAVRQLLALQLEDGGWAISGKAGDADVTAMTVQALTPHRDDEAVQSAIDRAVGFLSSRQTEDGGYISYGVPNPESAAQVWIALCGLDINALSDSRFIKNGCTVLDAILSYRLEDHSFSHTLGGQSNANATVQVLHALIAHQRMTEGKTPLLILDAQQQSTSDFSLSSLGYKPIAAAAVLALAVIVCIVLLLLKKKSPKNFLLVALCALTLILFIFTTSFSSTADYYKTAPEKQAVTGQVTLSILCDKVPELESSDYLPRDGVILPATVFDIAEGDTVYTVLTDAARAHEIHLESSGPDGMIYMRGIHNLYELQYGDLSGWIYFVNGTSPSLSCDQYTLQNGDTILWRYTCEMGSDL